MGCGLAALPAPDLHVPGVEIWILLQDREVGENVFLISRRAERNWIVTSYPARDRFQDMQNTATEQVIDVQDTVVVIAVSELPKSREWYSRLFGKAPDLEPFPGNVEFKIGGAWVQISKGQVKPSSWSLQLEVRDLARERERLRNHGIAATEIKTVPDVISFFDLSDPDGNAMRWFQVLTSDPKVTGNLA